MIELTKLQKKKVRELIDRALQRELKTFMLSVKDLVADVESSDNLQAMYQKLYSHVKTFDKRIAMRYDDIGGSKYFETVLVLYVEKKLTSEDISEFDDELKERIIEMAKMWDKS
jgi:hypothetical protein